MRNSIKLLAAGLLMVCAPAGAQLPPMVPSTAPSSAQEQVAKIERDFDAAQTEFYDKYSAAKTAAERKALSPTYPDAAPYSRRLLEIAKANPKTPAARDALEWIVKADPEDKNGALKILTADFAADQTAFREIGQYLQWSRSSSAEDFLRAVMAQNPNHVDKGRAQVYLAINLKNLAAYPPKPADQTTALQKQAEQLLDDVVKNFADINENGTSPAESAKRELFEMRNLSIGKTAPEITGESIDGKPMKLSDFRGKVVVLDFFGDW